MDTTKQIAEEMAAYLRPKIHRDSSSNVPDLGSTGVVELDFVHPAHGPRVLAYCRRHLETTPISDLKQQLDDLNIGFRLSQDAYAPVLVTESGDEVYTGPSGRESAETLI